MAIAGQQIGRMEDRVGRGCTGVLRIMEFVTLERETVELVAAIAERQLFWRHSGGDIEKTDHWPKLVVLIGDRLAEEHHSAAFGEDLTTFCNMIPDVLHQGFIFCELFEVELG